MALSNKSVVVIMAALAIVGRVGYFIDTPLWLDYFKANFSATDNHTLFPADQTANSTRTISPYFVLVSQTLVMSLVCGLALLVIALSFPQYITDFDRSYPKKYFLIIGVSQCVSSILFNFAISGSRTVPYLQAILSNFNIPIQFTIRFFVLRKRPTCLKLACAVAVMAAEFVCLIPRIFPHLESAQSIGEEGGSTGLAGVLWHTCLVASMIPFALANTLMERSVKSEDKSASASTARLNIVYFLFWYNLCVLVVALFCWWADLIPGFGTSSSIREFGEILWFDVRCVMGRAGCGAPVVSLAWLNYAINVLALFSFTVLMRASEGANFLIVVLTIRTPVLFLFWTLFEEQPFRWNPQVHLSTWLSLAAIAVMVPAVIVYDRAPAEKDLSADRRRTEDREPLLDHTGDYSTTDVSTDRQTEATCSEPLIDQTRNYSTTDVSTDMFQTEDRDPLVDHTRNYSTTDVSSDRPQTEDRGPIVDQTRNYGTTDVAYRSQIT